MPMTGTADMRNRQTSATNSTEIMKSGRSNNCDRSFRIGSISSIFFAVSIVIGGLFMTADGQRSCNDAKNAGSAPCTSGSDGKTESDYRGLAKLDPCLVGTWVSGISYVIDGSAGMAGIELTIRSDKSVTVDYTKMQPRKSFNEAGKLIATEAWNGAGNGHISTDSGQISLTSKNDSTVTRISVVNGNTRTNDVLSLAPVLVSGSYKNVYKCDGNSLVLSTLAGNTTLIQFNFTKKL